MTIPHNNAEDATIARSMGLAVILISNILLVQVNSSNTDFAFRSFIRLIKDKVMWAVNIGTIVLLLVMLYSPLNTFLKLAPLSINQILLIIGISIIAVMWYELVKLIKYLGNRIKKV